MEEKFKVKQFAGTDYRELDIKFAVAGACCLPFFVGFAVAAVLTGVEVIPSDEPIPVMLLFLFISCIPLACALFLLIRYYKAYKTAKYVFYNSVEVEAVPLDIIRTESESPPKTYNYGITYALLTRPKDLFLDWYRVRVGEDDEDADIFHVVTKMNEILVRDISIATMYRYNGYGYTRYTAHYPFKKESDVEKLMDMRKFKIFINVEKGIALYYKTEYLPSDGAENNHL